jgi:hypothetical protein
LLNCFGIRLGIAYRHLPGLGGLRRPGLEVCKR